METLNPDMKFALRFIQKCMFPVVSNIVPEESQLEPKNELVAKWIKESECDATPEPGMMSAHRITPSEGHRISRGFTCAPDQYDQWEGFKPDENWDENEDEERDRCRRGQLHRDSHSKLLLSTNSKPPCLINVFYSCYLKSRLSNLLSIIR